MSKVIKSPVKKWPGTVTLHDPLSLPQVVAVNNALTAISGQDDDVNVFEQHEAALPALLSCVEKWDLKGIDNPTIDTFPGTPISEAAKLFRWLLEEVMTLFEIEESPPNE